MSFDKSIVSIVRELVQFLESLGNVELPASINSVRESLLSRSKIVIHALSTEESLSAEPYLDMSVRKRLSLEEETAEIEEYVDAEQPQSRVSKYYYYESFAEVQEEAKTPDANNTSNNSLMENVVSIYASFSAEQTKSKCDKCGPLERKEGKRFFVLEQYRGSWVGLVGTHLLVYGSEHDNRPCMILPMRDYKARPAPKAIQRDPRRSEAAFEIFSPGNKTILFVARTPKDMEQWVAAICRVGCGENCLKRQNVVNYTSTVQKAESDAVASESMSMKDYQDVKMQESTAKVSPKRSAIMKQNMNQNMNIKKDNDRIDPPTKDALKNDDTPLPLPPRIPRRLTPTQIKSKELSYDTEDMDYGIYHKIEDFKEYQNIQMHIPTSKISNIETNDLETYDDVRNMAEKPRSIKKLEAETKKISVQKSVKDLETQDTYDDVFSLRMESNDQNENAEKEDLTKFSSDTIRRRLPIVSNQSESTCYDDVHEVAVQVKSKKEKQKTKVEGHSSPVEPPQKRSFFDRVRNRRDSPKKEEKKSKRNLPPTPQNIEELPTYDDITIVMVNVNPNINQRSGTPIGIEKPSQYNCPPPPKPIYNSPAVTNPKPEPKEDYYTDIANTQEIGMDQNNDKTVQRDLENQKVISKYNKVPISIIDKEELINSEHYQTPKSNPVTPAFQYDEVEENLYDDVANMREKTRLIGLAMKEEEEEAGGNKTNISSSPEKSIPERKPWKPFTTGRKNKVTENSSLETNKKPKDQITTPEEVYDDCVFLPNDTPGVRKNFQKLFNKY